VVIAGCGDGLGKGRSKQKLSLDFKNGRGSKITAPLKMSPNQPLPDEQQPISATAAGYKHVLVVVGAGFCRKHFFASRNISKWPSNNTASTCADASGS